MERSSRGAVVKTFLLLAMLIGIAGCIGYVAYSSRTSQQNNEEPAVSNPPPVVSDTPKTANVSVGIGEEARALGIRIKPISLIEDSRCPQEVQCFWAGTVKIKALLVGGLGTSTQVFELGKTVTVEDKTITLSAVLPVKNSTTTIQTGNYRFTFHIAKKASAGSAQNVPIQATFAKKIVYTEDQSVDKTPFEKDCVVRHGKFNTCGSICESTASICAEVCALTCELP